MRGTILMLLVCAALLASSCQDSQQPGEPKVGGDRDEHGCIGSAGYQWCPSTQKCQRMWEEYCEEYAEQYRGGEEEEQQCYVQGCHGLDIECGTEPVGVCDAMYMAGDFCRDFAECRMIEGECQFVESELFSECRDCIMRCENERDPMRAFDCEDECRRMMGKQ